MKYILFVIFLAGCVTTQEAETPKCKATEMIGFSYESAQEGLKVFLDAEKGCQEKHSPKVCVRTVTKTKNLSYQVICGLPND